MPHRRTVFFVSDGTGITAQMLGHSLLTQFEGVEFNQITLPFIDNVDKAEECLERIEREAHERWPLAASLILHRVGPLAPGDNIVLVVTASAHRQAAFESAEFLMDYLKTQAPFWKSEAGSDGRPQWVDARESDDAALARWHRKD